MAKEINSEIRIIASEPRWAKAFRAVMNSVAQEKKYLLRTEAPNLERIEKFVTAMNRAENPQFFAVRGDEVLGWCDIRRYETPALSHAGELGMGVRQDMRGQKIGHRLLETCLESAWKNGFLKVSLTVFTDNEAAIQMYRKFGFVEEGRLLKFAKVDGEFRDSLQMAKFCPNL